MIQIKGRGADCRSFTVTELNVGVYMPQVVEEREKKVQVILHKSRDGRGKLRGMIFFRFLQFVVSFEGCYLEEQRSCGELSVLVPASQEKEDAESSSAT